MKFNASVFVLGIALGAQAAPAFAAEEKRPIPTAGQLREFLKVYLSTIYTPLPAECLDTTKLFCVIDVPVQIVQFKGTDGVDRDYCIAQYPEVIKVLIPAANPRPLRIVWKLTANSIKASSGKTYDLNFHDQYGTLVTLDNSNQIRFGGQGDGGGNYYGHWFFMRNLRTNTGSATYLPVVVQSDQSDPTIQGVCGTGDPKIVNSN